MGDDHLGGGHDPPKWMIIYLGGGSGPPQVDDHPPGGGGGGGGGGCCAPPPPAACARSYCRPKERGCRYTAHKRRRIAGRPCGKVVFFNGGSGSRRGTFSCPRHPQRVSGELQSRELIDCRPYCRPAPLAPVFKERMSAHPLLALLRVFRSIRRPCTRI